MIDFAEPELNLNDTMSHQQSGLYRLHCLQLIYIFFLYYEFVIFGCFFKP